jgi:hypothetical protein
MHRDLWAISKDAFNAVVMALLATNQSQPNTAFGEVAQSLGVVFFTTNAVMQVVTLILSAIMASFERRTETPPKRWKQEARRCSND